MRRSRLASDPHRVAVALLLWGAGVSAQESSPLFAWPDGAKAAVSLTFDDARASQVDVGTRLLDRLGARATFYVVPDSVEKRLAGWREAVNGGHEIANHSLEHPCTGNFSWARGHALEGYDLASMRLELQEANRRLQELLGVRARHFAYPCGQSFVGRGSGTRSYVPLVAELFVTGRGWLDEALNDPAFVDLAQLQGMEMDGKTFPEIETILESARVSGSWVVFAGHEIGAAGPQTTRLEMLERLIPYARDPQNALWLAPVGEVAAYIRKSRSR